MDIESIFEHEHRTLMTRRHFFGLNAAGLGTAALASLLGKDLMADTERSQSDSRWRASRPASLCSQSQTCYLAVPVRRSLSDGFVRLQTAAR